MCKKRVSEKGERLREGGGFIILDRCKKENSVLKRLLLLFCY